MNTETPSLSSRLRAIENISDFSKRSKIPRRTLMRIRSGGDDYPVSATTKLALEAALKRIKPKARAAEAV